MVLNMADFGRCRKSLQTLWNASHNLANRLLSARGDVCVDFGWIAKVPKLAEFEQKAWAIAHGLNMADLGKHRKSPKPSERTPTSLQLHF